MSVDYLLVFLGGVFAGIVIHAFWMGITGRWRSTQKTIVDSDKTRKEAAEKLKKARADREAAQRRVFRIIFDAIVTGILIVVIVWIAYQVITG
jgi:formate/nitrite transporter FocA (FNT family)